MRYDLLKHFYFCTIVSSLFLMISGHSFAETMNVLPEAEPVLEENETSLAQDLQKNCENRFFVQLNIGPYLAEQHIHNGYTGYNESTVGINVQLHMGYIWKYIGLSGYLVTRPGWVYDPHTFHSYALFDYEPGSMFFDDSHTYGEVVTYHAMERGDWNRSLAGIGIKASLFAPIADRSIITAGFGAECLFGLLLDNHGYTNDFNIYLTVGYLYQLTEHVMLGTEIQYSDIITTVKGLTREHNFDKTAFVASLNFNFVATYLF